MNNGLPLNDDEWAYGGGLPTGAYKTVHDGSPEPDRNNRCNRCAKCQDDLVRT